MTICHAENCSDKSVWGFLRPPPNAYCKFHGLELLWDEDQKFFKTAAVQHLMVLEAEKDSRFERFIRGDADET